MASTFEMMLVVESGEKSLIGYIYGHSTTRVHMGLSSDQYQDMSGVLSEIYFLGFSMAYC